MKGRTTNMFSLSFAWCCGDGFKNKSTQSFASYQQLKAILQLNIVSLYDVDSMDSRTIQHITSRLINSRPHSTVQHCCTILIYFWHWMVRQHAAARHRTSLRVSMLCWTFIDKLVFAASNISTANTSGRRCDGQIDDRSDPTSSRVLITHCSYLYSVD